MVLCSSSTRESFEEEVKREKRRGRKGEREERILKKTVFQFKKGNLKVMPKDSHVGVHRGRDERKREREREL